MIWRSSCISLLKMLIRALNGRITGRITSEFKVHS
jgi:hypothetical protein